MRRTGRRVGAVEVGFEEHFPAPDRVYAEQFHRAAHPLRPICGFHKDDVPRQSSAVGWGVGVQKGVAVGSATVLVGALVGSGTRVEPATASVLVGRTVGEAAGEAGAGACGA